MKIRKSRRVRIKEKIQEAIKLLDRTNQTQTERVAQVLLEKAYAILER